MAESKEAHYGLRLTLGGAPTSWHSVPGLPGWYRPDRPTPVGGPGEATLEVARVLDKSEGCAVKLEKMTAKQVEDTRAELTEFRRSATSALRNVASTTGGHEATVAAEQSASNEPPKES